MESITALKFGESPSLAQKEILNRHGDYFLVRDVYHMFRDYNPLYRVRTQLGLSSRVVDDLSGAYTGKRLRPAQVNLYEGLDWLHRNRSGSVLGEIGFSIGGILRYARTLEVAALPYGTTGYSVVPSEPLVHCHLAWYMARQATMEFALAELIVHGGGTLWVDPRRQISRESAVKVVLEDFRKRLHRHLEWSIDSYVDLATECRLPMEEELREISSARSNGLEEGRDWDSYVADMRQEVE